MGSHNDLQAFSDIFSIDSRFNIPNNMTPARLNNGFMESKHNPLISGGDAKFSDAGHNFIGKRDDPFGSDELKEDFQKWFPGEERKMADPCFDPRLNSMSIDERCSDFMINFDGKKVKTNSLFKGAVEDSSKCQLSTLPATPNFK